MPNLLGKVLIVALFLAAVAVVFGGCNIVF